MHDVMPFGSAGSVAWRDQSRPASAGADPMKQMRSLFVDGKTYKWRAYHRHGRRDTPGGAVERGCVDVFVAYRDGYPRTPVRMLFTSGSGFPTREGLVFEGTSELWVNISRPRSAEMLIAHAIATGWQPTQADGGLEIPDGRAFLARLPADARKRLFEP